MTLSIFIPFLLALFVTSGGAQSVVVSCLRDNQCNDVTLRRDFVSCINNRCVCATERGFSGNATLDNKCRCDTPSNIYRIEGGDTYCYVIGDALAYRAEKTQEDFQTSIVRSVYNALLWPAPRDIMIALITGQPSIIYNYFADNASGRVDPVGTFSTHDGIVEYFYGLTWTGATKITQVIFKKLISQNNIVHSNVVLTFNLYDQAQQNIIFTYNLTQSGSFTFDTNNGKILSTDLIIHNLGQISDPQSPRTPEFINTVCYLILNVANCNATYDPLGFYADFPDCVQHFNLYQWGSMDNVYFNGNTSICRFFHTLLALGRPQVHCSHAGKTGNSKCVPHDYSSYYLHDYKRKRAIVATMIAS